MQQVITIESIEDAILEIALQKDNETKGFLELSKGGLWLLIDNSKILIKSFIGLEKFFSIITIDYTKNLKIDNLKINMKINSLKIIKKNNLVKINPVKLENKKLYRVNVIKNIRRIDGIKSLRDLLNVNLRTAMSFYDDSNFVFSLSKTQAKYLRKIEWLKLKRI